MPTQVTLEVNDDIYFVTVCLDFCLSTLLVGFRFDKVREQGACLNAEESIFWVGISDNFAGQISPFLCNYQTLWGNKRTGLSSYYSLLLFLLRLRVV